MIIPISYPLSTGIPLYPGTPTITITPEKSIDRGDSANTSVISMSSHAGTHIDVPRHFCDGGGSIKDVFQRVNSYSPVYCIDLPVTGEESIRPEDLDEKLTDKEDALVLLIRTGTSELRDSDPWAYMTTHPWVHPGVASFLRSRCPCLRIFGIDTISISTSSHRIEGHESHRTFLCDKNPIYLLEDADLSRVTPKNRFALTLVPWLLEDLDGVPVTAFLRTILS
jgi:arylformamidase